MKTLSLLAVALLVAAPMHALAAEDPAEVDAVVAAVKAANSGSSAPACAQLMSPAASVKKPSRERLSKAESVAMGGA